MKIWFFGTPALAVPTLEALAEAHQVTKVITPQPKSQGRSQQLVACPVLQAAQSLSIPTQTIERSAELIPLWESADCDLGIVMGFGYIFPRKILSLRPLVNIHFSFLPQFRGASPVQSAILAGETKSGITWQTLAPQLDSGDILWNCETPLGEHTTAQIWELMGEQAADETILFLDSFFRGKTTPQPQDHSQATFCHKFSRAQGEIFPAQETAAEIFRKWRAFTPWPGIWWEHPQYGRLKLLKLSAEKSAQGLLLETKEGALLVQELQPQNRQRISAGDFQRGYGELQ